LAEDRGVVDPSWASGFIGFSAGKRPVEPHVPTLQAWSEPIRRAQRATIRQRNRLAVARACAGG
jgi:hypothetical protein